MVDEMKPVHPVAPRPRWPFTRRQIVGQIIVAGVDNNCPGFVGKNDPVSKMQHIGQFASAEPPADDLLVREILPKCLPETD